MIQPISLFYIYQITSQNSTQYTIFLKCVSILECKQLWDGGSSCFKTFKLLPYPWKRKYTKSPASWDETTFMKNVITFNILQSGHAEDDSSLVTRTMVIFHLETKAIQV